VYDNDEKFPIALGLEGVTFSKRSPAHGRSLHGDGGGSCKCGFPSLDRNSPSLHTISYPMQTRLQALTLDSVIFITPASPYFNCPILRVFWSYVWKALHKHDTLWGMASVRRAVRHPKLSRCILHMSQSFLYAVAETRLAAGPSKWSRGRWYKMQPCSPRLLLDASVSAVPASATLPSGTRVSTDAYRFVALHVDLPHQAQTSHFAW
jgi:hypothetical protein